MKFLKVAAVVLALGTASVSAAQQPLPGNDAIAERIRSTLPQDFGNGVQLIDAAAEGQTLVIVAAASSELAAMSPEQIAASFSTGFCSQSLGFFEQGRQLRVDVRSADGSVRRGTPITRCPPR